MSILDYIFRQAPGAIAAVKRGKRVGDEEKRQRQDIQRKQTFEDQDRARRDAMDAANTQRLLEEYQMRQADAPLIREERAARIADLKARALGTGSYANRPVAAPAARNIDPNSPEGLAARKDFARYEAGLRPRATDPNAPKPGKTLPASALDKIGGYRNVLNAAKVAQESQTSATAAGVNSTGPLTGFLSGVTEKLGLAKPEAVSVRGKLANITSEIMKQRSGGAITPQEFVRLQPFLASKFDREEEASQKLADLIAYLQSNEETVLDTFEEGGYNVAKIKSATKGADPDRAEAEDAIKRGADPVKVKARYTAETGKPWQ